MNMHLVRRFFGSLLARELDESERSWVTHVLTPEELALWSRQPRYDRRHSHDVARRVERDLQSDGEARSEWLAAALLHDVGKIESQAGLPVRVAATVALRLLGRPRVGSWSGRRGVLGRFGRYAEHGTRGAALIRAHRGREPVARWAEIHHRVDPDVGDPDGIVPDRAVRALRDADRD